MSDPAEMDPGPGSGGQGEGQIDPFDDVQFDELAHLNEMATAHQL